nr:hypothetical transcript [Hymenolepis microstoma]
MLKFSICNLNQWVLDFKGNTERILKSIRVVKASGAKYRLGPELDITSYGCEDHFYEIDTYLHSWECISRILEATANDPSCRDVVCDIGAPVMFKLTQKSQIVRYNCRVILLNGRILLIRPKIVLADSGLHRESRWFFPWHSTWQLETYHLPKVVTDVCGQETAPFGCTILKFACGTVVGLETCEELWIVEDGFSRPHLIYSQSGANIVFNASASHHELRKLNRRLELISGASKHGNNIYAYSNLLGCDGGRTCFDGGAIVADRGEIITLGERFFLADVHINTVSVKITPNNKPIIKPETCIDVDFYLLDEIATPVPQIWFPQHLVEEEIANASAMWLWDNLRRSGAGGFFICLSGGLDSSSVACLVFHMCRRIYEEINGGNNGDGNTDVLRELRRVTCESDSYTPRSPRHICSRLLTTCFLPAEGITSSTSRTRAARLARAIACKHVETDITSATRAFIESTSKTLGRSDAPPKFESRGGTRRDDAALQNLQARCRLVAGYLTAQLLPQKSFPPPLLLSSANLDEALCGYLTKYDCSSADLNPIGSISKEDLRRFLAYFITNVRASECSEFDELASVLNEILEAQPTAELTPLGASGDVGQNDETDIGLTYSELLQLGTLRKKEALGPVGVFKRFMELNEVKNKLDASVAAEKVKLFFRKYSANRHKSTVLPPSLHMESYSADDNRFDLRPFLYRQDWPHQFEKMDEIVANMQN